MKRFMCATLCLALLPVLAGNSLPVPPKSERGKAGAQCRSGEKGPAVRVTIAGIKDAKGTLRLELYPATDKDFLASDKDLISAGKPFRRIDHKGFAAGSSTLCIRAPEPGTYALSVLHDRNGDGKFGFLSDGVGFSRNPKLGRSKPKVNTVSMRVGTGVEVAKIIMNYRRGLGFGPIGES